MVAAAGGAHHVSAQALGRGESTFWDTTQCCDCTEQLYGQGAVPVALGGARAAAGRARQGAGAGHQGGLPAAHVSPRRAAEARRAPAAERYQARAAGPAYKRVAPQQRCERALCWVRAPHSSDRRRVWLQDDRARKQKRKAPKRGTPEVKAQALKALPLAPPAPRPVMSFAQQTCNGIHREPEARRLIEPSVAARLEAGTLRLRVGRCGRVWLDQSDEASLQPLGEGVLTAEGADGKQDGASNGQSSPRGSGDKGATAAIAGRLQRLLEV